MIDWWIVFKVSTAIWAAVFAAFWLAITFVLVSGNSPYGSKEAAEDARRHQLKYTLTCFFWPITFPLLGLRRRRRRRKHRARAKHFQ